MGTRCGGAAHHRGRAAGSAAVATGGHRMSFGYPLALWLLVVIAVVAIVDQLRRGISSRPWPNILRLRAHATRIEAQPAIATRERRWRLWLGLALLVAALASPRAGFVSRPVDPTPREVVVAM